MNPSKSLKSHILEKSALESLMLKDVSVVPPDSIIKTFAHLKPSDIDLIISRDKEDLNPGSFVLRQGNFARFFLDLWFDPLFRRYNFAKAEVHALVCVSDFKIVLGWLCLRWFARIILFSGIRPSSLEWRWFPSEF